jgi:hypothetical protein
MTRRVAVEKRGKNIRRQASQEHTSSARQVPGQPRASVYAVRKRMPRIGPLYHERVDTVPDRETDALARLVAEIANPRPDVLCDAPVGGRDCSKTRQLERQPVRSGASAWLDQVRRDKAPEQPVSSAPREVCGDRDLLKRLLGPVHSERAQNRQRTRNRTNRGIRLHWRETIPFVITRAVLVRFIP